MHMAVIQQCEHGCVGARFMAWNGSEIYPTVLHAWGQQSGKAVVLKLHSDICVLAYSVIISLWLGWQSTVNTQPSSIASQLNCELSVKISRDPILCPPDYLHAWQKKISLLGIIWSLNLQISGAELAESPSEVPLSQVEDVHLFIGDRYINSLPVAVKQTVLPISQFLLQCSKYSLQQADKEWESTEEALYFFTCCS